MNKLEHEKANMRTLSHIRDQEHSMNTQTQVKTPIANNQLSFFLHIPFSELS